MTTNRLAQWLADEAAVRERQTVPAGTLVAPEALSRPGLDVLLDMLEG